MFTLRPFPFTSSPSRNGFSLVEVMIAMAIFGIAAAGFTMLIHHAYRSSTNAVYQSTAHAVAQGYVEQIMALQFATVSKAVNDPSTALALKALSPSAQAAGSEEMTDLLNFSGDEVAKKIVIDLRENDAGELSEVLMDMNVRLTATKRDVTAAGDWEGASGETRAFEITVHYRYARPLHRGWSSERISFVKSDVPI